MPRIRFVRTYTVRDDSGTTFEQGQVVTVSEASARHFETRGLAERVAATKRTKAPAKTVEDVPDGESGKSDAV